jgi:hypothetical protein
VTEPRAEPPAEGEPRRRKMPLSQAPAKSKNYSWPAQHRCHRLRALLILCQVTGVVNFR